MGTNASAVTSKQEAHEPRLGERVETLGAGGSVASCRAIILAGFSARSTPEAVSPDTVPRTRAVRSGAVRGPPHRSLHHSGEGCIWDAGPGECGEGAAHPGARDIRPRWHRRGSSS